MRFALCYKSMPAQTFFFADATLISLTFYSICIKLVLPIENWVWCKKQFARGIFAPGWEGGHSLMLRSCPNWEKKNTTGWRNYSFSKQFCTNWSDNKFTELKVYFYFYFYSPPGPTGFSLCDSYYCILQCDLPPLSPHCMWRGPAGPKFEPG